MESGIWQGSSTLVSSCRQALGWLFLRSTFQEGKQHSRTWIFRLFRRCRFLEGSFEDDESPSRSTHPQGRLSQ
jgi:hypothetical protein